MKFKNFSPVKSNNIQISYGGLTAEVDASFNSVIIHGDGNNLTVSIAQELGDSENDLQMDYAQPLFEIELTEEEAETFHDHEDVHYNTQLNQNAVILNVYDYFEWSKEHLCYLIDKGVSIAIENILANESIY